MNFKIGDRVRFLNEKGEGVISKMLNKATVSVTIETGFDIPYAISELILIRDQAKEVSDSIAAESIVTPVETRSTRAYQEEEEGVYIAFSPEKINDIAYSGMNVWLINHTSYKIVFTCSVVRNGSFVTVKTANLDTFESQLIETIGRKSVEEFSNFKIDVLFFNETEHDYQLPVSEIIKLKPIKLYKENAFTQNSFIIEKALIMNVCILNDDEEEEQPLPKADLSKVLFQKQTHSDTPKKSKPHANNNPAYEMEIDLHIEELLDSYSGMSNAEIIQVQLKHFQNALDKAINDHYRKLVVIHGVGNGRLKQEVRSILSSYNNLRVYDGSYSKYGFGATEVLIS